MKMDDLGELPWIGNICRVSEISKQGINISLPKVC